VVITNPCITDLCDLEDGILRIGIALGFSGVPDQNVIDLACFIANQLGLKAEIKLIPSNQIPLALERGTINIGIGDIPLSAEFAEKLTFIPFNNQRLTQLRLTINTNSIVFGFFLELLGLSSSPVQAQNDLVSIFPPLFENIGVLAGSIADIYLTTQQSRGLFPDLVIVRFNSLQEAQTALSTNAITTFLDENQLPIPGAAFPDYASFIQPLPIEFQVFINNIVVASECVKLATSIQCLIDKLREDVCATQCAVNHQGCDCVDPTVLHNLVSV